ncbi:uncharacterized protein GGS22DRAFT_184475 [Annulohypoxylon maeteangense]|uniref:uncharacterized protein n=1 Tax=Annulohypoxylon maeteangense TaxID=1927788 RepID=UPI002007F17B|nr:uncharacterized protein GGS22DRAFT_184475 [Annulohypoxylon maeteangense]KAI0888899.1 hypothetical protein GGS22DRAFT_184475 [Annulohypoxylon maeteangense]
MDIGDFSEHIKYKGLFDWIKQEAQQAYSRRGEKVQDHPPPKILAQNFITSRDYEYKSPLGTNSQKVFAARVPISYPPCVRPVQELEPLMISKMTLETHHRGKQTLIRVLTPATREVYVVAVVEDEEGTALLMQLYNQPEEEVVGADKILRQGDVCIIKEPVFRSNICNDYMIQVDHASDIIWLRDADPRIPPKWRKRVQAPDKSSKDIRLEGNAAVQSRKWAEAEQLYTDAIRAAKTPEEERLAHLNRSLANLRLERPGKALDDALKGHANKDLPNEKALFREAKALYSLRKFNPCLEKLSAVVRINPKNSDAWAEIKRVKQRIQEEETGVYDFIDMHKQSECTPPLIDCATYVGPVEVRDSPGQGKGLFTTKPVKAGELLLCEKAFAYTYAENDCPIGKANMTFLMDLNSNTMTLGGQANLIAQVVQKIYHNHAEGKVVTELHHGDYPKVATSEVDGAPVVDSFLITKIVQQNSIGAGRSTLKDLAPPEPNSRPKKPPVFYKNCGIWPLAARINHACNENSHRSFIGDMILIRSSTDLVANTEIFHDYRHARAHETYDQTCKALQRWGFMCACALCREKKVTWWYMEWRRQVVCNELHLLVREIDTVAGVARPLETAGVLGSMYAPRPKMASVLLEMEPVLRLELWEAFSELGIQLVLVGELQERLEEQLEMYIKGLEMHIKGLEELGYVVEASMPREKGEKEKKAKLQIKRWGQVNEGVIYAFSSMLTAYDKLAPELCEVVKEYAGVAYSIVFGEKETIGLYFPILAS